MADAVHVVGASGRSGAALCRALLRSGHVAFRWEGSAPPAGATLYPEPARPWVSAVLVRLLRSDASATFNVVTTGDESVARNIFEWGGWRVALQAVLAYDPAHDATRIVQAVQQGLDWQRRALPPGCRLLFGPGHDGGFAVVAGASLDLLDRFIADLEAEIARVG